MFGLKEGIITDVEIVYEQPHPHDPSSKQFKWKYKIEGRQQKAECWFHTETAARKDLDQNLEAKCMVYRIISSLERQEFLLSEILEYMRSRS